MKRTYLPLVMLLTMAMLFTACAPKATPESAPVQAPAEEQATEVQPTEEQAAEEQPVDASDMNIALVTAGSVGKVGFMYLSGEGYKLAANDFGFEQRLLDSEVPEEWERNVRTAAQDGADLIVGVGVLDAFQNVAPEFPDTKFALVDDDPGLPNTVGLISQEQEGTYLAGIVAAQMTTDTDLEGINDAKVIGFIGGMDVPVIHRFLSGLQQGVDYIDPDVQIVVSYVGSWNDPAKAKELALSMINNQDVDIIYSVGGSPCDTGVFEAVKEKGIYGIGSDINWDEQVPGSILTSVLKHTDIVVYDIIDRYVHGEWQSGEIDYGVASGVMDITDMSVMGDKIPQSVRDTLADVKEKIKSGEIVIERPEN